MPSIPAAPSIEQEYVYITLEEQDYHRKGVVQDGGRSGREHVSEKERE